MKKTIKKLLLTALIVSSTYVHAASNKTFLTPRPIGMDLAMESITFNEVCTNNSNNAGNKNFEVTAFYSESTNKSDLANYFSPTGKNSFTLRTYNGASSNGIAVPPLNNNANLNTGLMLYDNFGTYYNATGTISYSPSQEIYGLKFSYHQNLDSIVKGLFFRTKLPVVHVKNSMGIHIQEPPIVENVNDFTNYFNGAQRELFFAANGAVQNKLKKAIINGSHTVNAAADLELILGYTLLNKEKYTLALNLGLIIPTGNIAKGIYVFEPIAGRGGHFGLGLGYDFSWRIWGNDHANIKFNSALDWRYIFQATETRTFGITSNIYPLGFGQYSITTPTPIGGSVGNVTTNPTANVNTIHAKVTPGNTIDGIAGFAFNYKKFTVDLGYNLFYKEAESVTHHRITDGANSLFVSCNQGLDGSFGGSTLTATTEAVALTNSLLDDNTASSASQLSNKVYGGIGYIFKDMEYPINLAVGGHYEFAANNATVENWGVHIKTGISF